MLFSDVYDSTSNSSNSIQLANIRYIYDRRYNKSNDVYVERFKIINRGICRRNNMKEVLAWIEALAWLVVTVGVVRVIAIVIGLATA